MRNRPYPMTAEELHKEAEECLYTANKVPKGDEHRGATLGVMAAVLSAGASIRYALDEILKEIRSR